MESDELASALELAVRAAEAPRATILAHFRRPDLETELKADGSPVTAVDRWAEREIRAVLGGVPGAQDTAVLGEEFGLDDAAGPYCWMIDPIDGTDSFTRGLPTFGTLIALVERSTERPLAGAIHLPLLAETYAAARGLGAFCNGEPIQASSADELSLAVIALPDPWQFRAADAGDGYLELAGHCEHLRGYGSPFAHAMAARGSVDAVLEPWMNPWDIKATEVIVEEAGGACLLRRSRRLTDNGRSALDGLFGSPALVDQIAEIVGF